MGSDDWAAVGIIITILVTVIGGWVGYLQKSVGRRMTVLESLPFDYVPRPQIDKRFAELERRWESEFKRLEGRSEKQFDQVNAKLDRILERLEQKADK